MRRLILLSALFAAAPALAGDVWNSASCSTYSDGSGYCYGTFLGFRNDSYQWSEVEFVSENGTPFFQAQTGNGYFACTPVGATAGAWASAMSSHGYFYIAWNSSAQCTDVSVYNTSSAN